MIVEEAQIPTTMPVPGPLNAVLAVLPKARRLFVGGIGASGKTAACAVACAAVPDRIQHEEAGRLACELGPRHRLVSESMEAAQEASLDRLQDLLHASLLRRLEAPCCRHRLALIDGHFVIGAESARPYPVPVALFQGLELDGLVVCLAAPAEINKRRLHDASHRRALVSESELAVAQLRETRHARRLARELGLPLVGMWAHTARHLGSASGLNGGGVPA